MLPSPLSCEGHFRLTSLLMPALLKSPDARVVNVASSAHLLASSVEWEDLNAQAPGAYAPWKAYGLSKLSNIYFTKALQRRLDSKGGVGCLLPYGNKKSGFAC